MPRKKEEEKAEVSLARHEKDTGSPEVQIAALTARIKAMTEHLKRHRKDVHSRYSLVKMAAQRRKLLRYLKENDFAKYREVVHSLGLRG
ncbi:MAG: 30S ribosomal protein S15 [candidate division WOR-3 bacterium]